MDGLRPELAGYSIYDLLQEITHRPEFFGVAIYANRPPFDVDPAPDDKLLIAHPVDFDPLGSIRLLARAIDILAFDAERDKRNSGALRTPPEDED